MSFGENLQYLRKKHAVTQEELADELQVSRQTVSKWEQDACYPEMEKIIALCKKFSVSMDSLLLGSVADAPAETAPDATFPPTEKAAYEKHMNRFAFSMALGVCLILLGVALLLLVLSFNFNGAKTVSVFTLLAFIAVAVFLFVFSGIRHGDFMKEANLSHVSYTKQQLNAFNIRFAVAMAGGVFLILAGVILLLVVILPTDFPDQTLYQRASALLLSFIAVACFLFVFFGIQHNKYHKSELTEEENSEKSKAKKICDAISGCIMMLATVLFLLLGFLCDLWHPAWVVFPVGGILCGIVSTIGDVNKKS